MEQTTKTPEQIAAEAAAAKATKEAEKQAKAEAAAAKKAAEKAAKDAEKAAAKAAKEAEKEAKALALANAKAAKEAEKAAKQAAKQTEKQPEQNGIVRPKPNTACGKAWAIMDSLSMKAGSATPIAPVLEVAKTEGLNEGNVKCEYSRWRKFHGVTGRIVAPKPHVETTNPDPAGEAVDNNGAAE